MRRIKFIISEDGKITFDFDGFQGNACLQEFQKLLRELESAGIVIEKRETKVKDVPAIPQKEVMMQ